MILLISKFIRQSRELAKATRGREAFEKVSEILQSIFEIDCGFIAYKKQFFLDDAPDLKVYSPWGFDQATSASLSRLVLEDQRWQHPEWYVKTERWTPVEKTNSPWKEIWMRHDIQQVGIWPIEIQNRIVGGIVLGRKTGDFAEDADVLSLCAIQISLILDMLATRRLAEHASQHDPLTSILNRRGFENYIAQLKEDQQNPEQCALGVLDVDNFKFYNDNYGHKGGDAVLIDIAETLRNGIGKNGCCARFGGDEFVFILKGVPEVERAIADIESLFYPKPYAVSVGGNGWNPSKEDWEIAFRTADQNLYLNKGLKK